MAAIRRTSPFPSPEARLLPLTAGLAAAAVVELLVLRTFTRTAIHIPALEPLQEPYKVLSFLGRYAYFVSLALLAAALPLLAYGLAREARRGWQIAVGAVSLFASVAILGAAGEIARFWLDLVTLVAVVALAAVVAGRWHLHATLPFAMLAAAFVTSGGYTVMQSASQRGAEVADVAWMLTLAEYAGVLFALSLPLLLATRADRVSLSAGAIFGLFAFVSFAGEGGSTSRILLLWNEGLSGTLPGTIYALCAATLATTFVALLRTGRTQPAIGLALLVAGGLGLHNTYQSGLVIAGLAVLALSGPAGIRPVATQLIDGAPSADSKPC